VRCLAFHRLGTGGLNGHPTLCLAMHLTARQPPSVQVLPHKGFIQRPSRPCKNVTGRTHGMAQSAEGKHVHESLSQERRRGSLHPQQKLEAAEIKIEGQRETIRVLEAALTAQQASTQVLHKQLRVRHLSVAAGSLHRQCSSRHYASLTLCHARCSHSGHSRSHAARCTTHAAAV
jgi:hypothetical protein